jgi:chromosome segregation ATPase
MNKYFAAADALKRQASKYESMIAAADALAEIGSFEQAAEEAKLAADTYAKQATDAKADLVKAKDAIKKANADAQAKLEKALEGAKTDADSIIKDAEVSAAEILKKAQDEGSALMAQAATEKARMSSEIGGLQKSILDAQTELASLLKAREAASQSAADAEGKLDSIRGKLKALAGL